MSQNTGYACSHWHLTFHPTDVTNSPKRPPLGRHVTNRLFFSKLKFREIYYSCCHSSCTVQLWCTAAVLNRSIVCCSSDTETCSEGHGVSCGMYSYVCVCVHICMCVCVCVCINWFTSTSVLCSFSLEPVAHFTWSPLRLSYLFSSISR
jgi:hypothetical protein